MCIQDKKTVVFLEKRTDLAVILDFQKATPCIAIFNPTKFLFFQFDCFQNDSFSDFQVRDKPSSSSKF